MFNLFFRPYVPGFRVKAQKDVPGFNIGENDGAPMTPPIVTSFTLGSDGLTQSAPPIGFAGIRVEPQDDVPGFNLNESGVPRQWAPWFDGMRPGSATSEYPDTLEPEALPRDAGEPVHAATASRVACRAPEHATAAIVDRVRSSDRPAHRALCTADPPAQRLPADRPARAHNGRHTGR